MSRERWKRIHRLVSWSSKCVALGIFGYSGYGVFTGRIRIATRFTDATFVLAQVPGPFWAAVAVWIGGGFMFLWIAGAIRGE